MKDKLVVTLTTVYGSRQFSLGQIARYAVLIFLLLSLISFFISNWLLVKTTDDLSDLEQDHQKLNQQYEMMLGTQTLYKSELDELSASLSAVSGERDRLQAENIRMGDKLNEESSLVGELNATLGAHLKGLESVLDVEPEEGVSSADRLESMVQIAQLRLFMLNVIPNGLPIQAIRISDRFGMRMHPTLKKKNMHHGIDFKADKGTPVYATADAIVEYSGNRRDGYGKQVVLSHSFGFKTNYSHLDKMTVSNGEFVHKGQKIAESGNSGRSTGPHLHYEVRHMYRAIDPEPFMAWNIANFDSIFTKVKSVKWASLKNLYPLNQIDQP